MKPNTRVGGITVEQIFAYTYAVLHDPVYRDNYAVDLTSGAPAAAPLSRLRPMGADGTGAP